MYFICDWLKEWEFWAALASILGGIFAIFKYFDNKKTEKWKQEFDDYHKLIERINKPLNSEQKVFLQVQQAAIFELRNYKRYKELTKILLAHWRDNDEFKDIVADTLNFLEDK